MRRVVAVLLALTIPIALASPARAATFPSSIPLPVDFAPEGIAVGPGSTFYVGSLTSGDVYRGDLSTGQGALFVDAAPGRSAVGLKPDVAHGLLVVSGGFTGAAYFYDLVTGAPVATVQLGQPGATLINDVVVTRDAAWFTDSFAPVLYRVPLSGHGVVGARSTLALSGPAAFIDPTFPNLNGIAATADGRTLIVGHTVLNAILTVDPATGQSAVLVDGLPDKTLDGLLLQGRTLWAMANFANTLFRVTLSPDRSTGVVTGTITSSAFHVPTTLARFGDRLALVNGRFDLGFPPPLGPGAPPGTTYDVVVVSSHG